MTNKICKISLFTVILATMSPVSSYGAIKAKNANRSYADAYGQINNMRYQQEQMMAAQNLATTASATGDLPVAVDDARLAESIANNTANDVTKADLDACSMIYPNGVFRWGVPESGIRHNPSQQCMAVVELRDANTNAVLATTTLAAGDSMKCNIDHFPESGYNASALYHVELPADAAPTEKDVEEVMNEEQKQNAGLKIVAAALVSGVAGNMLAPKEAGKDTGSIPVGTSKSQLISTAISATAGAGVMAASTYSGKVAGDTIKSTAVNAASGMIIGNMLAGTSGSGSILSTVKCSYKNTEYDCIIGNMVSIESSIVNEEDKFYVINKSGAVKLCKKSKDDYFTCTNDSGLLNVKIKAGGREFTFDELMSEKESSEQIHAERYTPETGRGSDIFRKIGESENNTDSTWYLVDSANKAGSRTHAYALFEYGDLKALSGYTTSDWDKTLKSKAKLYVARNSDGSTGRPIQTTEGTGKDAAVKFQFEPSNKTAEDGGIVDLSNKNRLKGTVAGGAAGAALGGMSGYAGAQNEITQRWLAAKREYEDSLSNFVCMSGGRFLSQYNDYFEIPAMRKLD